MVRGCLRDSLEEEVLNVLLGQRKRRLLASAGNHAHHLRVLFGPAEIVSTFQIICLHARYGLFFLKTPHIVQKVVDAQSDSLISRVYKVLTTSLQKVAD